MGVVEGGVHPVRVNGTLVFLVNEDESFDELGAIVVINCELVGLELVLPDHEDLDLLENHKDRTDSEHHEVEPSKGVLFHGEIFVDLLIEDEGLGPRRNHKEVEEGEGQHLEVVHEEPVSKLVEEDGLSDVVLATVN